MEIISPNVRDDERRDAAIDCESYLAQAVAAVRDHGYVAAAAIEAPPTWQIALDRFARGEPLAPADGRRAREIRGWASSLKPRRADSYRARMAACLRHERLTAEELPLAASAVRTFNRHLYFEIRGRKAAQRRRCNEAQEGAHAAAQRTPRQRDV